MKAKRVAALAAILLLGTAWSAWAGADTGDEQRQYYPTSEACFEAHELACAQSEQGWFVAEELVVGEGSGSKDEPDWENLERQRISMPTNLSGTLEAPVIAVDMTQVRFPDVQPYLDKEIGRVRVPIRFVAEQMGAAVAWEGETQTVTITRENMTIVLRVDDPTVIVNGEAKQTDAPPTLFPPGRVMVPLRFISETFGAVVDWVGEDSPIESDRSWGKYQVWIWVDWGYWGKASVYERLNVHSWWFYRDVRGQ